MTGPLQTARTGVGEAALGIIPPYPGPLHEQFGYTNSEDFLDAAYRQTFGTEPPPRPTTTTRQIAHIELPGITLTLDQRQVAPPDSQAVGHHEGGAR